MLDSVARVIMFRVLEAKSDPLSEFSWGDCQLRRCCKRSRDLIQRSGDLSGLSGVLCCRK